MTTGEGGLGYSLPFSDDDRTVEKSLLAVVERIENGNESEETIHEAIKAHNEGAASVDRYKIALNQIIWPDGNDAKKKIFKELVANGYPLKCKHGGATWKDWRKKTASCSRHYKTSFNMFQEPILNARMMIGNACEQTALLALCMAKNLNIVDEFSGVSFMHREYDIVFSPDAVVYSPEDEKLFVVEIKTASDMKGSALLGTNHRMLSGRTQLQLGLRLLDICTSGILVDFALDRNSKRQSMKIEYFDVTSKVYTFGGNGKRTEMKPEVWFKNWHERTKDKQFEGKANINKWRSDHSN